MLEFEAWRAKKQAEQAKTVTAQVRILEFSLFQSTQYKFDGLEHVRCSLTKSGRHVLDN